MNINKEVIPYSTGFTKDKRKDKKIAAGIFYRQYALLENATMIEERMLENTAVHKQNSLLQKMSASKTGKDKIRHLNALHKQGKNILLNDILFEMFQKALFLDTEFIQENNVSLRSYFEDYITTRGGFTLLENAIVDSNSTLLKEIKKVCEAVATRACNRKMTEDADAITIFDVNDDEKDKFDYAKNDLDMDSLSDLVKQKVLTVVQDEKDKTEERQQFMDDLQNELVGSKDVTDEKEVSEAVSKMVTKNTKEFPSLFEALMTSSYKELLEGLGASNTSNYGKRRETVKSYNVESDEHDVAKDEFEDEDEDSDEVNEDDISKNKKKSKKEKDEECASCESTIDMDLVMAEAITKYTVLELFNTLKLEVMTSDKKRKLIESLIY